MSIWTLASLIAAVAVLGVLGGAATRYERYGPARHRGPAGAAAVISLFLAMTVALVAFAVATLQGDGTAWRLLGAACALGVLGGLVAARGVDHYLVLNSVGAAGRAVGTDVQRAGLSVRRLLALLPWDRLTSALSGDAYRRQRTRS